MKFKIEAIVSGRAMTFEVEKTEVTKTTETYIVRIKDRSVTLRNNRLLFRSKGLKHRKGVWKLVVGQFKNTYAMESICEAIEKADPE